jgi:hypothetical protein
MDTDFLEAHIAKSFRFLATEWGFEERPSVKQIGMWSVRKYRIVDLGIDIEFEYGNRIVDILLIRIENGVEPEEGYLEKGRIVRKRLYKVLLEQNQISMDDIHTRRKKFESNRKRKTISQDKEQLIIEEIDSEAEQLREYMPLIMERKNMLFE